MGGLGNCNPIVDWSLEDVFNYISHYKIPHHPLHTKGYPSIGDAKDTVPIPNDGSVKICSETFKFIGDKTKWLGYGLERQGRFVGLPETKEGKTKTECGIHMNDDEKESERDLWISEDNITEIVT
jgi:3'-phosphoadenosine 5'-phosphosulfate sulfotransferase (PAPS reductase)/FAD synthetase